MSALCSRDLCVTCYVATRVLTPTARSIFEQIIHMEMYIIYNINSVGRIELIVSAAAVKSFSVRTIKMSYISYIYIYD